MTTATLRDLNGLGRFGDIDLDFLELEEEDTEEFKYDPYQPRAPAGSETGGQWMDQSGYSKSGDRWVDKDGKPAPGKIQARLKELVVPPAWTNVRVNPDPNAAMLVKGKDGKGRNVYKYSKANSEALSAEKFERLKAFNSIMPSVQKQSLTDMQNARLTRPERDAAAATYLISRTGFRIGSEGDTGAKVQAYGATTLLSKHMRISGSTVDLSFIGKKGVEINHSLEDKHLASYLKGRSGKLFDTDATEVRRYFKAVAGEQFKVKDMRTWKGTSIALQAVAKLPKPTSQTAFKKSRLAVAKTVAAVLGNTPTVALSAYIDQTVFARWAL